MIVVAERVVRKLVLKPGKEPDLQYEKAVVGFINALLSALAKKDIKSPWAITISGQDEVLIISGRSSPRTLNSLLISIREEIPGPAKTSKEATIAWLTQLGEQGEIEYHPHVPRPVDDEFILLTQSNPEYPPFRRRDFQVSFQHPLLGEIPRVRLQDEVKFNILQVRPPLSASEAELSIIGPLDRATSSLSTEDYQFYSLPSLRLSPHSME